MSSEAEFIALSAPHLHGNEWAYVKDCLDGGWVSSAGSYVTRFEGQLAEAAGTAHAVATQSGTAALHVALLTCGVRPNDEVVVPSMTFIAPINAITYAGALPLLADCDAQHWQLDVTALREFLRQGCTRQADGLYNKQSGRRLAAIIAVHILGHPVDMTALMQLAADFDLKVIEDATESLGSTLQGRPTGGIGHVGCFSFNGNKIITTGGGGMLVTQDRAIADKARYLTTQAKDDAQEYIHREIGYNYRLTNLQAAVGCAQMELLDGHVRRRREITALYQHHLAGLNGLRFQQEAADVQSNCWLCTVRTDAAALGLSARQLRDALRAKRIETRTLWQPGHLSPAHANAPRLPCPVAEDLYENCLSLPSSSFLNDEQVMRVIAAILDFCKAR
jgi:perosamine synthetase